MRASAKIVASKPTGDHPCRYDTLRSDPPLLLRPTPEALYLVGGAAGPLGGDRLALDVSVGREANLVVRSAAASMALPGPEASSFEVQVVVGENASLDWAPEHLISVTGSRHRQHSTIELAPGAVLRWRESVVLGRSSEGPGELASILRITRSGRVLTHQGLSIGRQGSGWDSTSVMGDFRCLVTEVRVGLAPDATGETTVWSDSTSRAAAVPFGDDGRTFQAVGQTSVDAERALRALLG